MFHPNKGKSTLPSPPLSGDLDCIQLSPLTLMCVL